MASFIADPVTDALETRPAPERTFPHDGALLTQTDFRTEQLYHRALLSRLALHLHGAGTVAGLDVRYVPAAGGAEVEVEVAPGLAIDRLGRLIEIPTRSCLPLAAWVAQQDAEDETRAALQAGLRAAAGPLPVHAVADVYLGYHACAQVPEPAFASANADTIDGVQPSRIRDYGKLDLVVRPADDDRAPQSLVASQIPDTVPPGDLPAALRDYKRLTAWDVTRSDGAPGRFRMASGGTLSEHVPGTVQDGTEIFLARLAIPLVTGGGAGPRFDGTIDLSQAQFVPDQSIRPYSYSAEEIALLAADLRR
ncbi:hypothetical protein [Poseidonocella sp. HB161398]|uniref:hypothetical protein n=1 Tax=Poseidonocella sp. HB161398 TaxID=2320855 RepID=UPI0011093049|nr:hypothetical protein [Poseidonocella sp. HB161398]